MSASKITFGLFLITIYCGNIIGQLNPSCDNTKLHRLYPVSDINMFYFCRDENTPYISYCPSGTGFLSNDEAEGCVPWSAWNCTYKGPEPECKAGTEEAITRHLDPNYYFVCKETDTKLIVPCPDGSGYTYTDKLAGCVPWDLWKCEDQL